MGVFAAGEDGVAPVEVHQVAGGAAQRQGNACQQEALLSCGKGGEGVERLQDLEREGGRNVAHEESRSTLKGSNNKLNARQATVPWLKKYSTPPSSNPSPTLPPNPTSLSKAVERKGTSQVFPPQGVMQEQVGAVPCSRHAPIPLQRLAVQQVDRGAEGVEVLSRAQ